MSINMAKVLWKLGSIDTMEFYEAVKNDIYEYANKMETRLYGEKKSG